MWKIALLPSLLYSLFLLLFTSDCLPILPPCISGPPAPEYILDESQRPQNKYQNMQDLPTSLDWRWYQNQTWTSRVRNSLVQSYCGACWAFAATSALTDRINIQTKHSFPEWSLSPQTLLDCDERSNGCKGGNVGTAYEYIRQYGIASDSCSPYRAMGRDSNPNACNAMAKCMQCSAHNHCGPQYPYQAWKIKSYGNATNEEGMIQALQEGPIVCGMFITEGFETLNNFNVYKDNNNNKAQQLAVSIVGYGNTTDGQKYWIGRNSWGDYWGDHGYFRIIRGINNLGIESLCYWATPEAKPYTVHENGTTIKVEKSVQDTNINIVSTKSGYPNVFKWNDMNGTNYITPVRNQNVPNYCLSDWAFAVTSMMSDRLNIERAGFNDTISWPEIIFSVQSLLNLPSGQISANCYGCQNLHSVMKYIASKFVPIESCQLYIGNDEGPSNAHECEICNNPGNPKQCYTKSNFTAYTFSNWGPITGENAMKQSIYEFGPIVCGMDATPQFKQYQSGIYQQFLFTVSINHYVEIIGWGELPNNGSIQPYWIGKNSWGQYWGEQGLFKIQTKTNNLGIETDCFSAIPQQKTSIMNE